MHPICPGGDITQHTQGGEAGPESFQEGPTVTGIKGRWDLWSGEPGLGNGLGSCRSSSVSCPYGFAFLRARLLFVHLFRKKEGYSRGL